MAIDIRRYTMGEIAHIESLSGQSIKVLEADESPVGLTLAAVALVEKRRQGVPDFTWNQAQALTFLEVQEILGTGEADTETTEGKAPEVSSSKPKSKKTD